MHASSFIHRFTLQMPATISWARPKLGARDPVWVSRVGERDMNKDASSLSARVCINRRLELGAELGLEHRHSNMGYRHPKWFIMVY